MHKIVCQHWNFCINKTTDKCYKCLYNDYLNVAHEYHSYNFEKDNNENWLETTKIEYDSEQFDLNEFL